MKRVIVMAFLVVFGAVAIAQPHVDPAHAQLQSAYQAFAAGNVDASDRALTSMLRSRPSAEAYLLRGAVRYTRAMLSRDPDPMLGAAKNDFRAALKMKKALRLNRNAFSPKLVAFFEEVRNGG
ncbi:MAG TPA: hypothetical protein VF980_00960 [Thermoanaerobaculia bacterium]